VHLLLEFTFTELKNWFEAASYYKHCVCWGKVIIYCQYSLYFGRKQQLIVVIGVVLLLHLKIAEVLQTFSELQKGEVDTIIKLRDQVHLLGVSMMQDVASHFG
jgi:hypothetical protein